PLDKADQHARPRLKAPPHHPDVLNLSGVLALQTNRPKQALRLLVRAVEEAPQNPQFHYNLASAHKQLGDAQSALAAFQHAVILKPDYVEAHNNLGNLYQAADE
ncbi:MAG: tetratricopeptide repeat protein, partial [Alphaproteobacteria bacterium]